MIEQNDMSSSSGQVSSGGEPPHGQASIANDKTAVVKGYLTVTWSIQWMTYCVRGRCMGDDDGSNSASMASYLVRLVRHRGSHVSSQAR